MTGAAAPDATAAAPTRLSAARLQVGPSVGAGAEGSIHHVTGDLPAFGFPLIFKRFAPKTPVSGTTLEQLARYRAGLSADERRALDAFTVWPCAVVEDGGRVIGYLMQEIPDRFLQIIEATTGSERIPREIQHLFVADALAVRNLGEAPNRVERLLLARSMAFGLGFLHRQGFVYGDLSYKNAVYTLRPTPQIMLLDCDAVRREGQGAAVAQLNSPGWSPPEGGPQTKLTDRYKLGLFVLRCLTPGVNAQNRAPDKAAAVLDAAGLALLQRALGDDPEARPSGGDWVAYLDGVLARTVAPDRRDDAAPRPARATVPRRAPVPNRPAQSVVRGGVALRPVVPIGRGSPASGVAAAPGAGTGPPAPPGSSPSPAGSVWSTLIAPRSSHAGLLGTAAAAPSMRAGYALATFVVLVGVVAFLLGVVGRAGQTLAGASSTTQASIRTVTSLPPFMSTTTVAPTGPVRVTAGLGDAEAAAATAVGPGARLVAVSTAGTLGAAVPPPASPATLDAPSPQWVFQYVAESGGAGGGAAGDVAVRAVTVADGAVVADTTTNVPLADGERLPAMAPTWPGSLEQAARRVVTADRLGQPVRISWVCDPAPGGTDCRWLFRFGAGDAAAVFVSDGGSVTPRPSWFRDAQG